MDQNPISANHQDSWEEATQKIFARWRWLALAATLSGLGGGLYAFLAVPTWEVKTTLIFPLRQSSFVNLNTQAGGALAALGGGGGIGGPSILKVNQEILESESILDMVINEAKPALRDNENALKFRKRMREDRKITTDQATNTITVSVTGRDKTELKRMVDVYIDALRRKSLALNVNYMESDAKVLRTRAKKTQEDLKVASAQLSALQSKLVSQPAVLTSGTGESSVIVALPGKSLELLRGIETERASTQAAIETIVQGLRTTAKASATLPTDIPAISPLRERLIKLEYSLKREEISKGPENPDVVLLTRELKLAREQLNQEVSKYLRSIDLNVASPDLAQLIVKRESLAAQSQVLQKMVNLAPKEASQYQELLRKTTTLTLLSQRLEAQALAADLAATQEPNRWNILDYARFSDEPINQRPLKAGAIWTAIGLLVGTLLAAFIPLGTTRRKTLD